MSETAITEAILSAGQNEGVERSVLPLPQLARVQNARQRKSGRWGKRYGTAALPIVNSSGAALGSGLGNMRAIGPGYCVVDDQCAVYDQTAATWQDPRKTVANYAIPFAFVANPRIPGAVSGWLPASSYYPVPAASAHDQIHTPCSSAYCIGYLWSVIEYIDPATPTQTMIRVTATNPVDQALAFLLDIRSAAGTRYPRLVACGATLVLVYVDGTDIKARNLTSLAGGFGATTTFESGFVTLSGTAPGSQIGFDAAPMTTDSTVFLLATSLLATIDLKVVNAAALTVTSSAVLAPFSSGAGGPTVGTSVSIIGDAQGANGRIWVTWGSYQTTTTEKQTKVSAYRGDLAAQIGTATLASGALGNANNAQSYATVIPGKKVRVVFAFTNTVSGAATIPQFSFADVDTTGTLSSAVFTQPRFQPISRPFTIGARVYVWGTTTDILNSYGYATLLRLPADSEIVGGSPGGTINCPLEMSVQDFVVSPGANVPSGDELGIPPAVQIGSSATYTILIPTLTTLSAAPAHDFRVIQAKHYTDIQAARSVQAVATDGASFVPLGTLTRVDSRGATEAGFALLPIVFNPVAAAGGGLTASSSYQYTAVYIAKNSNGRTEVSAPSAPVKATLAAGQTKVTLNVGMLEVGARAMCQIQIYRTLSNGTGFYLLDTIDGSEGSGSSNFQTYADVIADTTIASHQVLYTQVGQALPNAFPPPSRFAATGGQRVWLGGLLRGDVVHCSKLILGDQSPTWCDNDAFRVVLPATVTGLAWMDNLLIFTTEGVYVVSGDGPDDSGTGEFSPPVRLPFAFGCVEPRSVITTDEGTFFQTARGLYMVPRGFGAPVPAGDMVLDSLAAFPVICGCTSLIKAQEQTLRWACMDSQDAGTGLQIVYDLTHKSWSVDLLTDPQGQHPGTAGICALGQWFGGELAMMCSTPPTPQLLVTNSTFSDSGTSIAMQLQSGDLRPFGTMSEGVMSKVDTMVELRTNCTLNVTKTTEWGSSPPASRVFASAAGDTQPGQKSYVETELGSAELRDAVSLSLLWSESSAGEGLAFVAIAIEHEESEGLKRVSPLSRAT
jgi:hypothetical protein